MKKLFTKVPKKDGKLKKVYVVVDDETANALEFLDEKTRENYLQEEYEIKMAELKNQRYVSSLDSWSENGYDVVDEQQDIERIVMRKMTCESVRKVIRMLEPQQQYIVDQIFYKGRTQVELAKELGIKPPSITKRLDRIYEKIKKLLK